MAISVFNDSRYEAARDHFFLESDFFHYVTADDWTTVASDLGSIATVATGVGGTLLISPSDGSVADNDESYLKSTVRAFKFAEDKPCGFALSGIFTEPASPDSNYILGFIEAIAADSLQDNGAGPPADYDGAVFFKVDGDAYWYVETSIGTTQTTTKTNIAASSSSQQRFEIRCRMQGTTLYTTFWHAADPSAALKQVKDFTNSLEIEHTATVTGNAAMNAGVGAKNGGTNHSTVTVDYIAAWQKR